jgi:hypothetical protein
MRVKRVAVSAGMLFSESKTVNLTVFGIRIVTKIVINEDIDEVKHVFQPVQTHHLFQKGSRDPKNEMVLDRSPKNRKLKLLFDSVLC